MKCLRCETEMNCIGTEKLQLGQTGWFFGDLPNLLAGALPVRIYLCGKCGKMEFFSAPEQMEETQEFPKRVCPQCGSQHDFDDPKCPFCKFDYYSGR